MSYRHVLVGGSTFLNRAVRMYYERIIPWAVTTSMVGSA